MQSPSFFVIRISQTGLFCREKVTNSAFLFSSVEKPLFLGLTRSPVFIIIYWLSGCGEAWYRAWFGSKRPRVRIPPLRPEKKHLLSTGQKVFLFNEINPIRDL